MVSVLELVLANRILNNERYRQEMISLCELEQNRKFCRHDIGHCLSVARIMLLLCMEKGITADAEIVYAAALLHDIGRAAEYKDGTPHQYAGIALAREILSECDCTESSKSQILHLIAAHRGKAEENSLEYLFYLADKRSRTCFACPACDECFWPPEKRTMEIKE